MQRRYKIKTINSYSIQKNLRFNSNIPTTETREASQELTPFDRGQIYGE